MTTPLTEFDPQDVLVRPATLDDHRRICELFDEGALEGQVGDNDTGADIDHLAEAYLKDGGASGFWVATLDGEVVGMIGVQNTHENTGEIRRLRVTSACRRRGVGTRLMHQALNFCREQGYLKVTLDVRIERAPALAMFEKFGFALARTREVDDRRTLDFYLDLYRDPH